MTSSFEFSDYKIALRELLLGRKKQFGSRFTFERMAAACGVQKTYLSKVLNSEGHLNPDQTFSAVQFLKLPQIEQDYVLLLREKQQSSNPVRIKELAQKIDRLRRAQLKTESSIVRETNSSVDDQWDYFADIDLQLVHVFLTISNFAVDPSLIESKIGIGKGRLDKILLQLEKMQLVRFTNGRYEPIDPSFHLSQDSKVYEVYRTLTRVKALERLSHNRQSNEDDYFFAVIVSAEKTFQVKFRKKILALIKEMQDDVSDSKPQDVFQMNLDFFRWS